MCNPTVGQEGGAWSHTQEWGLKASVGSGQQIRLGFYLQWPLLLQPQPDTMSGRVGDLSPKQAETLAKVRAPSLGAPEG